MRRMKPPNPAVSNRFLRRAPGAGRRARRAAAALAVLLAVRAAIAGEPAAFPQGVAAGDASASGAVLWTRAADAGLIRVEVATDANFATVDFSGTADARDDADRTVKIVASGLSADTAYLYRFSRVDEPQRRSRAGRFRTAPAAGAAPPVRFGFSGDTNFQAAPFGVMGRAAAEDFDFFIWFGDTIYADAPAGGLGVARTLDEYRGKYEQGRSDAGERRLLASCGAIVGWDDHEVQNDYAGLDPALDRAQQAAGYRAFFEWQPIVPQDGGGDPFRTYRRVRWGRHVELFLLDARQYRDASAQAACDSNIDPAGFLPLNPLGDGACVSELRAARSMLGRAQLDWLKAGLAESDATQKFVINNVPLSVIGLYPYDRWDGYDAERRELLEFIDGRAISGVTFLTTDIHANAYNPDVLRFFCRYRPDYDLAGNVAVAEAIVGPLGNETLRETALGFGELLSEGFAVSGLAGALPGLERWVEARLTALNGLAMLQTNRESYLVVGVDGAGGATLTWRGAAPPAQRSTSPTIETFYESAPRQPAAADGAPALPCFVPFAALLALSAWMSRAGSRNRN